MPGTENVNHAPREDRLRKPIRGLLNHPGLALDGVGERAALGEVIEGG